jgi:hypothetical protein
MCRGSEGSEPLWANNDFEICDPTIMKAVFSPGGKRNRPFRGIAGAQIQNGLGGDALSQNDWHQSG